MAEALARFPARNVRELGGALNLVFAIQDLEERQVSAEEVAKMLGQPGVVMPTKGAQPASPDDFTTFMNEISETVASTVEQQEEAWRKLFRQTAEAAEREGFSAGRLRELLEGPEPDGCEATAQKFGADLKRLREVEAELDLEHVISVHVRRVLERTAGNKSATARLLGISRSRLQRYVDKFKL